MSPQVANNCLSPNQKEAIILFARFQASPNKAIKRILIKDASKAFGLDMTFSPFDTSDDWSRKLVLDLVEKKGLYLSLSGNNPRLYEVQKSKLSPGAVESMMKGYCNELKLPTPRNYILLEGKNLLYQTRDNSVINGDFFYTATKGIVFVDKEAFCHLPDKQQAKTLSESLLRHELAHDSFRQKFGDNYYYAKVQSFNNKVVLGKQVDEACSIYASICGGREIAKAEISRQLSALWSPLYSHARNIMISCIAEYAKENSPTSYKAIIEGQKLGPIELRAACKKVSRQFLDNPKHSDKFLNYFMDYYKKALLLETSALESKMQNEKFQGIKLP